MILCIPVLVIKLAHFLFKLGNLFRVQFIYLCVWACLTAMLGGCHFSQCFSVRKADGAHGRHQLHPFKLARSPHVAQNIRYVGCEIVDSPFTGFYTNHSRHRGPSGKLQSRVPVF